MNSKEMSGTTRINTETNFMIKSDNTHSRTFRNSFRKQKYHKQKTPILQNKCNVKPVNDHTLYSYFFNILFWLFFIS